jgi:hypothetical protein
MNIVGAKGLDEALAQLRMLVTLASDMQVAATAGSDAEADRLLVQRHDKPRH